MLDYIFSAETKNGAQTQTGFSTLTGSFNEFIEFSEFYKGKNVSIWRCLLLHLSS